MPRKLIRSPRRAEEYEQEEEPPRRLLQRDRGDRRKDEADDDGDLAVGKGWGGYRRTKANAPSKWSSLYKVPDEEQLIMFLEDDPYASFLQHWCDWVPRGQKQSYICLQEDCPLDDIDPNPSARVRFNILDLAGDQPRLTTFECGMTVTDILDEDAQKESLSGRYFAVSMKGPKNSRRTQIRPVKVRDLEEDWSFAPLSEEEIAKYDSKLWDASSLEKSTRKELQQIADASAS
jgi:hypothetical protein